MVFGTHGVGKVGIELLSVLLDLYATRDQHNIMLTWTLTDSSVASSLTEKK